MPRERKRLHFGILQGSGNIFKVWRANFSLISIVQELYQLTFVKIYRLTFVKVMNENRVASLFESQCSCNFSFTRKCQRVEYASIFTVRVMLAQY